MKKTFFIVLLILVVSVVSCEMVTTEAATMNERSVTVIEETGTDKPKLLLVGDSRVFMWPSYYFTDDWDVYNIGVSGSTSQYAAFSILAQTAHFDTIIISSGINDYHEGISPGNTVTYLNIAIGWAKMKADNVYITTIPGVMYNGTSKSYNVSLHAAQANMLLPIVAVNNYIDCIPLSSLLCSGWFLKAMYTFDGIHYNGTAYQEIYNMYNTYIGQE